MPPCPSQRKGPDGNPGRFDGSGHRGRVWRGHVRRGHVHRRHVRRHHGRRHGRGSTGLEGLNRRITELDKKADRLPTKRQLADTLRAFADGLGRGGDNAAPQPDRS